MSPPKIAPGTSVRKCMSRRVITVGPDTGLAQAAKLMRARKIRHLPVVEGKKVVGVLSIGDLVKAVISAQSREIEQLQRYIAG